MDWSDIARATVAKVAASLPADASLKERKAALFAAYPFGERAYWPYKAWCKAQRDYLSKFGPDGHPLIAQRPTGLEHLPRDPITGRPVI